MTQPQSLLTPRLLLNNARMQDNIDRMNHRLHQFGVRARPHIKTAKSLPVIDRMTQGASNTRNPDARLTVSTVREAAEVVKAGYSDVLYAVGVVPQKFSELAELAQAPGVRLSVLLDSLEMADALIEFAAGRPTGLDAFIELDVDNHRAGVLPESDALLAIAARLASVGKLRGVMTHAGGAYDCLTQAELRGMAERERAGAVHAAKRLEDAGIVCAEVSIGSTPTVSVATSFEGVTEVRVGVYVFNDLVMAGLGVCDESQIALSVLTSVIGHQPRRNTLLIDAGWMALSNDRSTATHQQDMGLGKVAGSDLIVQSANQEHGLVGPMDDTALDFARYPIGSQLQILPIHACATAAAFEGYDVVEPSGAEENAVYWSRFGGWTAHSG